MEGKRWAWGLLFACAALIIAVVVWIASDMATAQATENLVRAGVSWGM